MLNFSTPYNKCILLSPAVKSNFQQTSSGDLWERLKISYFEKCQGWPYQIHGKKSFYSYFRTLKLNTIVDQRKGPANWNHTNTWTCSKNFKAFWSSMSVAFIKRCLSLRGNCFWVQKSELKWNINHFSSFKSQNQNGYASVGIPHSLK